MKTVQINNAINVKSNKNKNKKLAEEISVLTFNIDNHNYALRLSVVNEVALSYSSIFEVDNFHSAIIGFCLNNNRLINIIDINYILNIPSINNNKQLVEISRGDISVAIFIDENYSINQILLPFEYPKNSAYKFVEKIGKLANKNIFLINEILLFEEIKKQILIEK